MAFMVEGPEVDEHLDRLRSFCALLPETAEVDVFGNPTFRVGARGFATFEVIDGAASVCVKVELARQTLLIERPGFEAEVETGHFGWTHVVLDGPVGWDEVDELVIGSYRLVAPPELTAELDQLLGHTP